MSINFTSTFKLLRDLGKPYTPEQEQAAINIYYDQGGEAMIDYLLSLKRLDPPQDT